MVGAPIISMIAMLLAITSTQLKQTHLAASLFLTILLLATLPVDLPLRSLLPLVHTDVHFGPIVLAMVIVVNTMIVISLSLLMIHSRIVQVLEPKTQSLLIPSRMVQMLEPKTQSLLIPSKMVQMLEPKTQSLLKLARLIPTYRSFSP